MIGKKIIQLENVDSTNNYVANLIQSNNIEHGTVILADEQTAGKGQRGNTWYSKPGENIVTSIYLRPEKLSVIHQFYLTIYVSISILKTLKKFDLSPSIKWPNDILIGSKKITGVLVETHLNKSNIEHVIIGIGINVNQMDLNTINGTSIRMETNEFNPIYTVLLSLINELNLNWKHITNENFTFLKKEYLNNLWLYQQETIFTDNQSEFTGKIIDIDEIGRLIIQKGNQIQKYNLKEIKFNLRNEI
ncbi:MAG: biotin--[acetyl-CoA-carboxylase] ligase [Flavobacteriia bacterium]|nr:biotin--[acetyl-CoA-carboxylase] ligase [Flavobacteriia bacterium]